MKSTTFLENFHLPGDAPDLAPLDEAGVVSLRLRRSLPTPEVFMSELMLHRGARTVDRPELDAVYPPAPTDTWYPLKHSVVLDRVLQTLDASGYKIKKQQYALSADKHRFFGTLDLESPIADGISLSVGIRNSNDKSFPIGFMCGDRVFCCDNLAFSAETVIARKHTRFGERRFNDALSRAILGLRQYQDVAAKRIEALQRFDLSEDAANSYLLQAAEKGVVGWRLLPQVIREWREPSHEEFKPRTAWSLFNSFTEVIKERQLTQPARAAAETIQLQRLLLQENVIDVDAIPAGE
jgi:hypothetical protein